MKSLTKFFILLAILSFHACANDIADRFGEDEGLSSGVGTTRNTIISTPEQLKSLTNASFDAELANDIDLTNDENWTPIEGFKGSLDGKNYTIKGLSAPLFGTTEAKSIKNLKIEANITSDKGVVGALACAITNPKTVVENCSVSGRITIEGKLPTEVDLAVGANCYASLIGYSESTANFRNLESSAELTVSGTYDKEVIVAGVVAQHKGSLEKVTHLGKVSYKGATTNNLNISGVAHRAVLGITECVNGEKGNAEKGNISVEGSATNCYIAGVAARGYLTIAECHNFAPIKYSAEAKAAGVLHIGGLLETSASNIKSKVTKCSNQGTITVSSQNITGDTYVGGLLAIPSTAQGFTTLTDCNNYGDILFNNSTTGGFTYIGGLIGIFSTSKHATTLTGCENYGNVSFDDGIASNDLIIGGIVGYAAISTTLRLENCANHGKLHTKGACSSIFRMGGIVGVLSATSQSIFLGRITNSGEINYDNFNCGTAHIGGIIGATDKDNYTSQNFVLINTGNINGSKSGGAYAVGGIVGAINSGEYSIKNARCFCDITTKNANGTAMIAGTKHLYIYSSHAGGRVSTDGGNTFVTLNYQNYYQYLSRAAANWTAEDAKTKNCGYISSIYAKPAFEAPKTDGFIVPDMTTQPDTWVE